MRRKTQGFTLIEIMVVIAIIAGLIGTVAIIVPQMQEKQRRFGCQNNLQQLGGLFVEMTTEKSGRPPYVGQALWLSWRSKKSKIMSGQENILICPGDSNIVSPDSPEQKAKYDSVDLKNPGTDLCSYASRDFESHGISRDQTELELIGCDRQGPDGRTAHHKNGLVIAYSDGSARFVEREELGISGDDPIVVGPESSNDKLKKAIYNKKAE